MSERKLRVFLCHSSQDKPVVRELYQRLLAESWIDPWLDEEKLLPGQDWDMEIEKAVEETDAVIVCLSTDAVTKDGYVQKELRFVLNIAEEKQEGAVFIIPLRLNECRPPRRLRTWHYVDFFPASRQDLAYKKITSSLKLQSNNLETKRIERVSTAKSKVYLFSDRDASWLNSSMSSLTEAELEVLALIGEEVPIKEIAAKLETTMESVKSYVRQIRQKLGEDSLLEASRIILLTPSELGVLLMLDDQLHRRGIASEMGLTVEGIKARMPKIMEKLRVDSYPEALEIIRQFSFIT